MRKYLFLIVLLVVVLDRVTKWLVVQNIALHQNIQILPGLFRITHVQNPGAAFGLFSDSPAEWKIAALILFSLGALAVVTMLLWKNGTSMTATAIALSLILGGALGNLWDRIASGRVVDFLLFYISDYQWPAFNIADSAIVVGALMLVTEILFSKSPAPEPARENVIE